MAITNARMQVRRGLEKDFNPDEMKPGEWALSTDTKYIRMCIYPGLCLRMATYESFEQDMEQIQTILTEARTIQGAVTRINTEVSANAEAVAEYTSQAKQYRDEAESFKNQASAIVGVDIATESVPGLMAGGDNAVENGILTLTKVTTDRTLIKSNAGGLKVNSIEGESQQDGTPSPDVLIEIDSVVVGEIKSVGKNLYDEVKLNHAFAYSGITATKNANGQLSFSGTSTASINEALGTFTLPAGTYYMSSGTHGRVSARLYNRTSSAFLLTDKGTFTLETESSLDIRIQILNGVSVSGTLQMQIEVGSTATEYEPYHESIIQLSNPITLRGIGDVKDVLCKQNGVYGALRECEEIDASDKTWRLQSINANNIANFAIDVKHITNRVMCNRFKLQYTSIADTTTEGFFSNGSNIFIRTNADRVSTVDELTTWLSENQTIFTYRLATPTFEPLPLADQIALHQLETFDIVTYISTDSTIEPVIEVEYGTSVVGAYALKGMQTADANKLQIETYSVEIEQLKATTLSLSNALLESEV